LARSPGSTSRQTGNGRDRARDEAGGLVIIQAHNRLDTFFEWDLLAAALRGQFLPAKGWSAAMCCSTTTGSRTCATILHSGELKDSFEHAGLCVTEEHYMDYENVRIIDGPFKKLQADGFVFVGKKR